MSMTLDRFFYGESIYVSTKHLYNRPNDSAPCRHGIWIETTHREIFRLSYLETIQEKDWVEFEGTHGTIHAIMVARPIRFTHIRCLDRLLDTLIVRAIYKIKGAA
jgi:hypothetical protein